MRPSARKTPRRRHEPGKMVMLQAKVSARERHALKDLTVLSGKRKQSMSYPRNH